MTHDERMEEMARAIDWFVDADLSPAEWTRLAEAALVAAGVDRLEAELAEARRGREKFREALEKIASDRYNFRDFCDIARAALEGKA